ncbi:MAG: GFA family protein [Proteobacteria bacterium]|nr:GFA family protein [Pseudomonadota bacterium]
MITGQCLCGGVRFEVTQAVGPFELCHCSRCRKSSGSAFVAGLGVRTQDFRLRAGAELIRSYEAPLLECPPPYLVSFCGRCGSPVPNPPADADWFEIPAGLLDGDPGQRPDRHIFVERKSPWFEITDELHQLDKEELIALRREGADL